MKTNFSSYLTSGSPTNLSTPLSIIIIYTLLGGLVGSLIIGGIILVVTLGAGFIISLFTVFYGTILGTPPAFLTGLYLGLKRFTIVDGVGWRKVFWVGYLNSVVCLSFIFILKDLYSFHKNIADVLNFIPVILILSIFGGCSSCIIGSKVLPRINTTQKQI